MNLDKVEVGKITEMVVEITEDLSTNRTGKEGAEVLSTPSLLKLMEQCCIQATDHLLPEGHTTVGYAVDKMRHIAPTSMGSSVKIKSILEEVDRNRLTYTLEAFEGDKQIGSAIHKRAIISIA